MNRFTRQIRLVDVGEVGQAKLSAAEVSLRSDGFARTVEEAYLGAAGLRVCSSTTGAEIFTRRDEGGVDLGLRHAAARDVAAGAYAALLAMREVLGVGRGGAS